MAKPWILDNGEIAAMVLEPSRVLATAKQEIRGAGRVAELVQDGSYQEQGTVMNSVDRNGGEENDLGWLEFDSIPGPVHPSEVMLGDFSAERARQYGEAGASALQAIQTVLSSSSIQLEDVASFLDFGCGHGRVVRHIAQKLEPSRITAADIDPVGVDFCKKAFEVAGVVSTIRLDELNLGVFDLIWSGSVMTHLIKEDGDSLLKLYERHLTPGGIAIFSFHGEQALKFLQTHYGPECTSDERAIRDEVEDTGYSYRSYSSSSDDEPYGVTFHTKEYLLRRTEVAAPSLRFCDHLPAGWNLHHDILALQKQH